MSRKIYLASSWRNKIYPFVLQKLRDRGHEVYDFRAEGFHWKEVDPNWENWTTGEFVKALENNRAKDHFQQDMKALEWADTVVLVLPSGRSAHTELGWAVGRGLKTVVFEPNQEGSEPELMYGMIDAVCGSIDEVLAELEK